MSNSRWRRSNRRSRSTKRLWPISAASRRPCASPRWWRSGARTLNRASPNGNSFRLSWKLRCSRRSALGRRRELLEHVLNDIDHLALVLFWIPGQRLLASSAPDQPLRVRVEDVEYQLPDPDVLNPRRRHLRAESSPEPAAAETVVERLQLLFVLHRADRGNRRRSARFHLFPALRGKLVIHGAADAV